MAANLKTSAQKTVYIGKDIRTAAHNCNNIIGIIGQKDVEIIRDSDTDLALDAALIAQSGRVGRAWYDGVPAANKNVITIYGAIASNLRYGFAWSDNTGYQTRNFYYDNNLLYCPPPYFPSGTQYQMDLWEEQ